MIEKIRNAFRKVNEAFEWVSIFFLAIMVLVVFFNAVLRYVFHSAITVSEEIARFLFIWVCFLGASVAYQRKDHIVIDVITSRVPPRFQKILYGISRLCTTAVIIWLLRSSVLYLEQSSTAITNALRINYAVITVVMPVMCIYMLLNDLFDFLVFLQELTHRDGRNGQKEAK